MWIDDVWYATELIFLGMESIAFEPSANDEDATSSSET